mmetsp:Transcript_20304/g.36248  ORF Transcript_20304/g.36248 Transcript_20304/m.36248 type:complete len:335 (+) Transcript_20304:45-1049(+)
MPSASSGKRSVKSITSQSYVGKSASQQVKAAQWTGQFAWNDADHPSTSKSKISGSGGYPTSNIDYNKEWFEKKDGEYYCNLCGAWATDGHVESDKHEKRAANPEWYGFGGNAHQNSAAFTEAWFEKKDGEYYCNLCGAWATEGHIQSDKHKKRAANPEWYGYPAPSQAVAELCIPSQAVSELLPEPWCREFSEEHQLPWYFNPVTKVAQWEFPGLLSSGESRPVAESRQLASPVKLSIPPQYNHPWFEQRQGDWYCNLCECWATDTHIVGSKHQKRVQWPSYYGFPDPVSGDPERSHAATQQLPIVDGRAPAAYSAPPQTHSSEEVRQPVEVEV